MNKIFGVPILCCFVYNLPTSLKKPWLDIVLYCIRIIDIQEKSRLLKFCYVLATTAASSKGIFMASTYSTNQTNKECGICAINQSIFLRCLWWECIEKHDKNPFDVNLDFVHNFPGEIFTRFSGWAVQHNLTRCQCYKTALLRHWQTDTIS